MFSEIERHSLSIGRYWLERFLPVGVPGTATVYEAGAEALPLWEEIWPGPAMKLVGPLAGCPILNFAFFAKFRVGIFAGASACFCP